jgi:hypothetical protein
VATKIPYSKGFKLGDSYRFLKVPKLEVLDPKAPIPMEWDAYFGHYMPKMTPVEEEVIVFTKCVQYLDQAHRENFITRYYMKMPNGTYLVAA